MFCASCGIDNDVAAKFCRQCGAGVAASAASLAVDGRMRHPNSNPPIVHSGPSALQVRSPGTAAVLSGLIIGAGQLYNNDAKKGVVMFIAAVLGAMFTLGIATVGVWIWAMVDAYQVASGKGRHW